MDNIFSVSRINLFDQCPLQWKFHYLDKIPESSTPEAQIGSAVHTAIENYIKQSLNGKRKLSVNELVAEATSTVSNSEILGQVNRIFQDFLLTHEFNGRKILGVEENISQDIGKYKFRGRLDLIEIDGSIVTVTDWKSGRRIFSQSECNNSLQASAYALLLHKEYPNLRGIERFLCKFDFLRHNQIIETNRTPRDLKLVESYLVKKMDTITDAVKKGDFPPRPSHLCEWCGYASRCPIDIKASSPEELASRILVLEAVLKDSRKHLKVSVEKQGPVDVNGEVFDYYPNESENYPVDRFIEVLAEQEVDNPFRFLKVDTGQLKHLKPQILEKLLPLAESKVSTRFSHKRREE